MTKIWKVLVLLGVLLAACTGSALADSSIRVRVQDGNKSRTIITVEQTVEDFLAEQKINIGTKDILDKEENYVLQNNDTIVIDRAVPVYLSIDGTPKMLRTQAVTAGELKAFMEERDGCQYDLANMEENALLNEDTVVELITKTVLSNTTLEEIPFPTQVIEDNSLAYGTEIIEQEGSSGQKQVTVRETIIGGQTVEVTREETVLSEAVPAIVRKGMQKTVTVGGQVLHYQTALTVRATAYTPYDAGCNGVTATGTKAGYGTLAVDPRVIPLGSRVYIPGYGIATATDTGGAIKGSRIDVCYDDRSTALNWGVKNLTIYVLE